MSESVLEDITIVIPTLDRPDWCIKLINYYAHHNFPGHLVFCDSSKRKNFAKLNKYIRGNMKLRIKHLELRNVSLHKAIEHGIDFAAKNSLFFTQSGDDDFFDLNGLSKCANFLMKNKEYHSSLGRGYIIKYIVDQNSFKFRWVIKYWNPRNISDSSANNRVFNILNEYYNLEFSLRRTEGAIENYENMNRFLGTLNFQQSTIAETCSVINIAFSGKSGFIRTPYLFRGEHSNRPNAIKNLFPNSTYVFENRIQTYEKYHLLLNKKAKNLPQLMLDIRGFYLAYTERVFKTINRRSNRGYKILQLPNRIHKKLYGIIYKVKYGTLIKTFK